MELGAIFQNRVLTTMLIAWFLAQVIKIPLDFLYILGHLLMMQQLRIAKDGI